MEKNEMGQITVEGVQLVFTDKVPILKININVDVMTTLFPKVATNGVIHVVEDIILTEDSLSVMQVRLTLQYHYIFVR